MKTIELTISLTGATSITTKGFAGSGCKAATAALEKSLGVATSDVNTAEFYQSATTDVSANEYQ